jgi:hypothetical protein
MSTRRHGRLAANHVDDAELHVDVMRFFAIVALCLFAILPHTEAPTPIRETQPLQRVAPQPSMPSAPQKTVKVPESLPPNLSLPLDEKPKKQVVQTPGSTTDNGGVRFMDANTFTAAVKNGAIRLVYHREDASFVFDSVSSSFTLADDARLQLFDLADAEVPESFRQVAPEVHGIKGTHAQWFITLPERTLAHLLDAASDTGSTITLNDRAVPM